MEKERKITAPDGCEIEKVELVDGVVTVTFKAKERVLPKNWEEFCDWNPIKKGEAYISGSAEIYTCEPDERDKNDRDLLPDRETAEAVLALCQLIQLRECYNQGWKPDWNDENEKKYLILLKGGEPLKRAPFYTMAYSPLYFKTEELCDEFLENFRDLINRLRPLYGIMEGGVR